jgi:hypothetical protein
MWFLPSHDVRGPISEFLQVLLTVTRRLEVALESVRSSGSDDGS